MRTGLFLLVGVLLLAAMLILARLFAGEFPGANRVALAAYLVLWLAITGFNMWVGVTRAGYPASEELPIFLMLFALPALAAAAIVWKLG